MQKLILIVYSAFVFSTRLEFDSQDCLYYLNKFDQKRYHFGGEAVKINSTLVQVNLKYWDEIYFDDPKYFGLVQEDGKSPESTCLDMKIFKFSNKNYTNKEQVFDIKIFPLENSQEKIRFYSLQFTLQELQSRMIKQENSNYYVYKGYYSIEFYAVETDDIQFYFYFEFTIFVSKFEYFKEIDGSIDDTSFKSLSQYEATFLEDDLILYWCKDFSCDEVTQASPNYYNWDNIYARLLVQQRRYYFEELCYLNDTEVWYTSDDGLYKKVEISSIDNEVSGQVKIVLNTNIIWKKFQFTVISKCVYQQGESSQIFEQVSGNSGIIELEYLERESKFRDCEDQCISNGFAQLPSCNTDCERFYIVCELPAPSIDDEQNDFIDDEYNDGVDIIEILYMILFSLLYVGFVLKCLPKQLDLQQELSMIFHYIDEN